MHLSIFLDFLKYHNLGWLILFFIIFIINVWNTFHVLYVIWIQSIFFLKTS
jgi:hypothetical protein